MKISVSQHLTKAKSHLKSGERSEAERLYREILSKFPNNKRAKDGLLTLHAPRSGQTAPTQEQINTLVVLLNRSRMAELHERLKPLLLKFPKSSVLYNIQGASYLGLSQYETAINCLNRAIILNPKYAEAFNNLGTAYLTLGRFDDARSALQKAISLKPRFVEARYNLGNVFNATGDYSTALENYKKAIEIQPSHLAANNSVCEHFEKLNQLEAYENAAEFMADKCGEENPETLLHLAKLASRKDQYSQAVGYLKSIQVERLSPLKQIAHYNLLGNTFDKLGQQADAYSAFEKQNEKSQITLQGTHFDPVKYYETTLSNTQSWIETGTVNWSGSVESDDNTDPVFLVGFPRSGTTLLDTILRSHKDISVYEELPMVNKTVVSYGQPETFDKLDQLTAKEIQNLRNVYFDELWLQAQGDVKTKVVVDKFPLNIIHVGLIKRLFPKAKFILALRHPCDCVLSSFMQNFSLNSAMANFLTLEDAAKLYASVFELWMQAGAKLDLDVQVIKYENLVQDLEGTCRPLIHSLGLEWDDNLHNYQATALGRDAIRTPSYTQVIKPLNSKADGRWLKYREQMQPVMPILQPWIENVGYSA